MLAAGVEQEPRPGLDDAAQLVALEGLPDAADLAREVVAERVERVDVQRQRDAAVAQLREDRQGVLEPVVGEAVGVVPGDHAAMVWQRSGRGQEEDAGGSRPAALSLSSMG